MFSYLPIISVFLFTTVTGNSIAAQHLKFVIDKDTQPIKFNSSLDYSGLDLNQKFYLENSKVKIVSAELDIQIAEEKRIEEEKRKAEEERIKKEEEENKLRLLAIQKAEEKKRQQAKIASQKATLAKSQPIPSIISGDFESAINSSCSVYGCNSTQLIRIMYCESGGRSNAINGIHKGLFQFNPRTFAANAPRAGLADANIWNPYHQIQVTAYMFANGQAWQWSCK